MSGLYIKDDAVNEMAIKLMKVTNAPSKTEAVRRAIQNELNRYANEKPLAERVAEIQARVKSRMGDKPVVFDEKAFMDEGWEL